MQKHCTKFQHDWRIYKDARSQGVLGGFLDIFRFLKELEKRTISIDEVQEDKQTWKFRSQESKK